MNWLHWGMLNFYIEACDKWKNQTNIHITKTFCALVVSFYEIAADCKGLDISTYDIESNTRTKIFLQILYAAIIWANHKRDAMMTTYVWYQDQQNSISIFSGKVPSVSYVTQQETACMQT